MKVIQELYSTNGFRKNIELNVDSVVKQNNVILPFTKHSHVIWVNKKEYPIVFRTAKLRDTAYNLLEANGDNDITLDLELFYTHCLTPQQTKLSIKNNSYKFDKHLLACAQFVLDTNNITFEQLTETDAFNTFSKTQMKKFKQGESLNINYEQLYIFSKTLRYPRIFHDYISPLDFWVNLYELRTTSSSNQSPATS